MSCGTTRVQKRRTANGGEITAGDSRLRESGDVNPVLNHLLRAVQSKKYVHEHIDCINNNNNNNNNNSGSRVRFGVRRRHRGSPLALGYHQCIIIVAIQDEGEGEGGTLAESVIPCICPV